MRIEKTALSISWIPSASVHGLLKTGFDLKVAHFDDPPPERIESIAQLHELRDNDCLPLLQRALCLDRC